MLTLAVQIPNFGEQAETVGAVVLGAALATAGGFIGARLEGWIGRRERERDAALLLGELVFALAMVLKMAGESRGIGDPYGPITLGMLRAARREAMAYERIRERLADLREARLRIRIHTLVLSIGMALEGIIEMTERIDAGAGTGMPVDEARRRRDQSFDYIIATIGDFEPLVRGLGKVARVSFERHEALVRF